MSEFSHFRINHSTHFADRQNHINGIENFWGLCKVRLSKFRGIHKHNFYLHIKECEFRYNCRNKNLYLILLKEFRCNPLKLSRTIVKSIPKRDIKEKNTICKHSITAVIEEK